VFAKKLPLLRILNIHKITKTLTFFKKHIVGIHMGLKQPPQTFNFGLASNLIFAYRTLSIWQKTNIHQNQGSIDKKIDFFPSPRDNNHSPFPLH
jgi:hypothetical protein